jgi:hypothetical protein
LILMERVLKLKQRYFYLRSEGKIYKGIVPFVPSSPIEVTYPNLTEPCSSELN